MKLASLKRKWSGQKASDGLGLISAESYCLRIDQYGGVGACGSGTVITEVFKTPQDALAWLRFTAIPFILAYDAEPEKAGPPKAAERYLPHYRGRKKGTLAGFLNSLDVAMVCLKLEKRALDRLVGRYNYLFHCTNPSSTIVAHGRTMDFLYSAELQREIKDTLQDEDDPQVLAFLKALKARSVELKEPAHAQALCDLLERLNKF